MLQSSALSPITGSVIYSCVLIISRCYFVNVIRLNHQPRRELKWSNDKPTKNGKCSTNNTKPATTTLILRRQWTESFHFYSKHQQVKHIERPITVGSVKAEAVEKTTTYQATRILVANITLLLNEVELSILHGTPATYVAKLIGSPS